MKSSALGSIVIIVLCFMAACGSDGGGSNGTPPDTEQQFRILSQDLTPHVDGDELLYSFERSACLNCTPETGVETVNFSAIDAWIPDGQSAFLRNTTFAVDGAGTTESDEDYIYYTLLNDQVRYVTSRLRIPANVGDPAEGILEVPGVMYVGCSWIQQSAYARIDGNDYAGFFYYKVVASEDISVPLGVVQSLKVDYFGSYTELGTVSKDARRLKVKGVVWINPQIGRVKTVQESTETFLGSDRHITFSDELMSINWDFERK